VAVIIKEFVHTWYAKITPDQAFVEEVVKIIAHCTRALEQRLRKVDLEALLFDELPELFDSHVVAYRTAHNPLHPPPLKSDPRQIYHSLCPNPALFPVPDTNFPYTELQQKENEEVYRQLLVQAVLAVILPTEDLESGCLTSLVGQIFSEMILGNGIGGKASEPWVLWEGLMKVAQVVKTKLPYTKAQKRVDVTANTFTEKSSEGGKAFKVKVSIQKWFWLILQYAFTVFTSLRFVIITLATSSSLPPRKSLYAASKRPSIDLSQTLAPPKTTTSPTSQSGRECIHQPIIGMKIWSCIFNLLDLDLRMPWLGATMSALQWAALRGPGMVGVTDGLIDKLVSHAIHTHALDPKLIPLLLHTARSTLFPNNALGPPRSIPSLAEQLEIRTLCAESLLELIPDRVQTVYFGRSSGKGDRVQAIEAVLDVFSDGYCNRHLMYGVVELVLVRLMPELGEKGVCELWEERLS